MLCSGRSRRRHPQLENFLVRKLINENCHATFSASSNYMYEPCVVSGVDPSQGRGPMPYFGYLVPNKEHLLMVHWPAKNVDTLVHLENITNIMAVAGESPIFLFSPYKEKAQQIRICYDDKEEKTHENAKKAIDVYLLDPPIVFITYLRRIWIQRLINFTLAPTDAILDSTSHAGSHHYEWLLQSISRSDIANPTNISEKISKISFWTKRDAAFRKSWWEDGTVFDWIFKHLRSLLFISNEIEKSIAAVLECLVVVLENSDDAIVWTVLEPRMEVLMEAVVRLCTNEDIQHTSLCIDILFSIIWLPLPHTHLQSPAQAMVQALIRILNWQNCLGQILNFFFSILKRERRNFLPEEIVFLFRTFLVFNRLTEERNGSDILHFIRLNYCEDFRYYVITDQFSAKFPEYCKLKNLVLSMRHKLERAILCDSKYSRFQ